MSLEAGAVLDLLGNPLYWHIPKDRTGGSLPDSRSLWDIFWENKGNISGFAHSHPSGMATPSHTDLTTFAAVEKGLGQRLDWWIVTPHYLILTRWVGRGVLSYKSLPLTLRPEWFEQLLEFSQYS